jgi:hypothetical protein
LGNVLQEKGFEIYEIGITDEVKIPPSYFRKAYNMSLLRSKKML